MSRAAGSPGATLKANGEVLRMAQDAGYDWRAEARRLWLAEAKRAEAAGDRKQAEYARHVANTMIPRG